MTPTPAAEPVGPQHEDWWSELEVHEIQQGDLDDIAETTLEFDPYA